MDNNGQNQGMGAGVQPPIQPSTQPQVQQAVQNANIQGQAANFQNAAETGERSVLMAGLLAIFLGGFGAHNFYLGYKRDGMLHAALGGGGILFVIIGTIVLSIGPTESIISSGYGIRLAVAGILSGLGWLIVAGSYVWGIIEGVMILSKPKVGKFSRDADGKGLMP